MKELEPLGKIWRADASQITDKYGISLYIMDATDLQVIMIMDMIHIVVKRIKTSTLNVNNPVPAVLFTLLSDSK